MLCNDCRGTQCTECEKEQYDYMYRVDEFVLLCFDCIGKADVRQRYEERRIRFSKFQAGQQKKKEELAPRVCTCGKTYKPTYTDQKLCRQCLLKITKGVCLHCNKVKGKLSEHGICKTCEDDAVIAYESGEKGDHYCMCGVYPKTFPDMICDIPECRKEHDAKPCPACPFEPNLIPSHRKYCAECDNHFKDLPF